MKTKDALSDPVLIQLAAAMKADPDDRLVERAFDDRCEELGVRFGNSTFRALFIVILQAEYDCERGDVADVRQS